MSAKFTEETILGIDPGLARVGVAVLRRSRGAQTLLAARTLTTDRGMTRGDRLASISRALDRLIARYRPTRAAMEKLFFQTNVRTAMAVSEARGVLLLACVKRQLPVTEFTPNEIKRAVAGYGAADKREVQKMVRLLLKLKASPADDDAADAVAIALTAALQPRGTYGT